MVCPSDPPLISLTRTAWRRPTPQTANTYSGSHAGGISRSCRNRDSPVPSAARPRDFHSAKPRKRSGSVGALAGGAGVGGEHNKSRFDHGAALVGVHAQPKVQHPPRLARIFRARGSLISLCLGTASFTPVAGLIQIAAFHPICSGMRIASGGSPRLISASRSSSRSSTAACRFCLASSMDSPCPLAPGISRQIAQKPPSGAGSITVVSSPFMKPAHTALPSF